MFLANVLDTFKDAWNIRNDYVASLYGFVGCSGSVFIFLSLLLLSENLLNGPLGILEMAVYFKGSRTLKNILVSPKDKDEMAKKNSIIYSYCCGEIDCNEEYIGESGRTFGERFREHLKTPSPIFNHQNTSGHRTSLDNFKIMWQEPYKKPCLSGSTTLP